MTSKLKHFLINAIILTGSVGILGGSGYLLVEGSGEFSDTEKVIAELAIAATGLALGWVTVVDRNKAEQRSQENKKQAYNF